MADELSILNFVQDLDEVRQAPEAERWLIENPAPLEVFVTLSSDMAPEEKFQARLLWDSYPDPPPSLKFRDIQTGRLDLPSAWPIVRGFRPASLDACVNYCREGFALHSEWVTDTNLKWQPSGNPLLRVIRKLQSEMDRHFSGRFKS